MSWLFGLTARENRVTIDTAAEQCLALQWPFTRTFDLKAGPVYAHYRYGEGLRAKLVEKYTVEGQLPPRFNVTVDFAGNDKDGWSMTVSASRLTDSATSPVLPKEPRQPRPPRLPEGLVDDEAMLDQALIAAARMSEADGGKPIEFGATPGFLRTLDLGTLDDRLAALLTERFPDLAARPWTVHTNESGDGLIVDLGKVENPTGGPTNDDDESYRRIQGAG